MRTTKKSKKDLLRQRAEKLLSKKSKTMPKIDKDIKALVHELQVHQIELEMQKEELRKAQEEIEESRIKYSEVYDLAPVGYFTFSRAGKILEVNLTGASLLGVDRSLLLNRSFLTFVDPNFRSLFRDHGMKVLKQEERARCELKLIKKDGKSFHASLESIPVPNGRNRRIRSAVSDITELKKAQEKAETEHAFRIAIENSILSGIAAVDLEGRQSHVNLGFCRMVGRTEEELVGRKPPFAYWPQEEVDHINRIFRMALNDRAPHEGVQLRFMRKNGERFDALLLPSPLKDHQGKVIGWIATIGDITHLKQMEKELKQLNTQLEDRVRQRTAELENANEQLKQEITERKRTEETLRYLASFPEMSPNPIAEMNLAGTIHYLNPAAKELFPDLSTSGIKHPLLAGLESFAGPLKEERKGAPRREVRIDNFWYEQVLFRVADMDRIRIYSRDITERKQAELLSQDLNDINLVVNSTLNFDEIMNQVAVQACKAIGAESAGISLRKGNEWVVSYVYGFPEETIGTKMIDEQEPHAVLAIQTKQVVVINDAFNDERVNLEHMRKYNVRSVIVIPLVTKERVIGVLFLNHHAVPVAFTNAQIDFAQKIGYSLTLSLENTNLFDDLRRSRDELGIRVQERTAELARVNEELRAEITERKSTEETLQQMTDKLTERIKEINCLYSVCYSIEKKYMGMEEKLQSIVHQIPSGWQYHEIACARITFENKEYPTENFKGTPWRQASQIVVDGKEAGTVEVYYLKEKPEAEEGPFTKEERSLINAIAIELGEMIGHMRADEAVKAERQRFNHVLEMLPAYVVLLTPDHHVPFANRFFRERFGESHGRRCFEYLFGRSEPWETCETYTVMKTNAPHHWEWAGPDGRNYDIYDFPFTDTDGSPLILEMGIDITERKQAEEASRTASLYARSLIEASLDPLITISAEGKVMDVNKATELVTGVGRQDLIGSDFSDYFTESVKAKEGYQQVFTEGSVRDYPLAIRHTSGKVTDVLYTATIYRNEAGEVQGVFAAARDISERKRIEEVLRDSENRLRYLSSQLLIVQENERRRISREVHDSLGQSLSAIKFKVESVIGQMRGNRNKKVAESLEAILPIVLTSIEESRRIQMDLRPSMLDDLGISATLSWFCRNFETTYSHIHIEKQVDIREEEISLPVKTVIYRISQEALNNIAKHSKAGSVRLSLMKMKRQIELRIEDNGMGFDLNQIISVESSKRGLGLTSMRERAELSGGSFSIETTPGKGTTIKASWPL